MCLYVFRSHFCVGLVLVLNEKNLKLIRDRGFLLRGHDAVRAQVLD